MAVMTVWLLFRLFVVLSHRSVDSWSPEGEKEYALMVSFSIYTSVLRENLKLLWKSFEASWKAWSLHLTVAHVSMFDEINKQIRLFLFFINISWKIWI